MKSAELAPRRNKKTKGENHGEKLRSFETSGGMVLLQYARLIT